MTNVVSISGLPVPQAGEPVPGLIEALKDLLAMAEKGELQSLWGSGFTHNGHRIAVKGGYHSNVYEFLGGLEWLASDYRVHVTGDEP